MRFKAFIGFSGRNIIIGIILSLCNIQVSWLRGQSFPLKISDNGNYLVDRYKKPFLINAIHISLFSGNEDAFNNIPRLGYMGINCVMINAPEITVNSKGKPLKSVRKNIRVLKRYTREAAIYNLGIIVSCQNSQSTLKGDTINLLYRKLKRFRNILWVPDPDGPGNFNQNPRQLKGCFSDSCKHSQAIFSITSNINIPDTSARRPVLFLSKPHSLIDSSVNLCRNNSYHAILKGFSGIITDQTSIKSVYNPPTHQMKQLKTVFDSLQWYNLQPEKQNNPTSAYIKNMSQSIYYIPEYQTLNLNLSRYSTKIKLSWINTVSGKVHHSGANPPPDNQLFLPPASDGKNTGWLLIIEPASNIQ